ncbi:MAG: 2-amino-4-hydroxy-6-hydroxymethyldihydropteridine diphosphokinase [Proteobacteria bacterium]|nr:2-amino-4-hydroxy-6-hydroxymethyldihydropteridine diphosphokinase [Pseudomonadota bacterium]
MILIALGGSIASKAGEPAQTLTAALSQLSRGGAYIERVSSYFVTPAWPDPSDPPFVNAVAQLKTALAPAALLALLHAIETEFGRIRSTPNAPRTLDLDLLDYDGLVQPGPPELPHPRMSARGFVLVPLAEIAPDWTHPVTGLGVGALLAALPETERNAIVRA